MILPVALLALELAVGAKSLRQSRRINWPCIRGPGNRFHHTRVLDTPRARLQFAAS